MNNIRNNTLTYRILPILGWLCIIITGLKLAESLLTPILIAFLIATISFPLSQWLRSKKVPRPLSVTFVLTINICSLFIFLFFITNAISNLQIEWQSKYAQLLNKKIELWHHDLEQMLVKINQQELAEKYLQKTSFKKAIKAIDINKVINFSAGFLGKIASIMGTFFLIFIFAIFMLHETRFFYRKFQSLSQQTFSNLAAVINASKDIQRYLIIKTFISLLTGTLASILCWSIGLDFALLWGAVAFLLNFIPAIGSIIAAIPACILALITLDFSSVAILAFGYIFINILLGNFIEPMLLGNRFGLSTLIVIIAVFFWGWLWGPAGMLLSIPLTLFIKILLANSKELYWIAEIIDHKKQS